MWLSSSLSLSLFLCLLCWCSCLSPKLSGMMIVNGGSHFLRPLLLLLLLPLLMWITLGNATQSGFASDVPAQPYDVAYRAYFRNYPTVRPCVLTAEASVGEKGLNGYWGCMIFNNTVAPHTLLLIDAEETARLSSQACGADAMPLRDWLMHDVALPGTTVTDGVALVVSTGANFSQSSALSCDMTCFLAAVQHYNELDDVATHTTLPAISAVAFSNHQQRCSFSGGPRYAGDPPLLLPRGVTTAYNFVVLYFPIEAGDDDWKTLTNAARFNRARWARGHSYPLNVLETRNGMPLAAAAVTTGTSRGSDPFSCLNWRSRSCVPFGGWTVWASNADTRWSWDNTAADFVKKTRKGAVALMVASTALTLVHGVTPGTDCPGSAIVATLSVLEALKRVGGDQGRDVYAFFFPGEHIGSIGSARFISDATLLECSQTGLSNCTGMAYGKELNFTTVNFSAVDTFLVVDQVGYGDAPLFYHVDSRLSGAVGEEEGERSAQHEAETLLQSLGVRRAATSQLPYSPITTVLDLIPDVAKTPGKVLLTLTRYNTTYENPDVFTVLDAAAENHSARNVAAVAEASDALLRVLLPNDSGATVNRSIVGELWECFTANTRCGLISDGAGADAGTEPPDYSLGAMSSSITPMQAAIEASLERLGWSQTLRSPAVSRALHIPKSGWNSRWEANEAWAQEHNESRYKLRVMSLWSSDVGARGVTVGSETLSLLFLLFSMAISGFVIIGFLGIVKRN